MIITIDRILLDCFWTPSGARLGLFKKDHDSKTNWIFLPGGPGLGSESLHTLIEGLIELPGSMWCLDLPGDGSNVLHNGVKLDISNSFVALEEATSHFNKPILVAHSTGGMYALSIPSLKKYLAGIILMGAAPDKTWQVSFIEHIKNNPIPGIHTLEKAYRSNPCFETLRDNTVAFAPYLFTDRGVAAGISLLEKLPYNFSAVEWSAKYFDEMYEAKWYPENLPALIFTGAQDKIVPLRFFLKDQRFKGKNTIIRDIPEAGHYPWVERADAVKELFGEFYRLATNLGVMEHQDW